jgi:ubiquinone/menaquinone biosynthesis C-methylase UbiE
MSWRIGDIAELEDAIMNLKMMLARKAGARKGMTAVDIGWGRGGFTAALSRTVGEQGRVVAVDVADGYLEEFKDRLKRRGVPKNVSFIRADAVNLRSVVADGFADVVTSYRFLEELKHPEDMMKIVQEMARIAKENGRVSIIEMSTEPRNEAEEAYIRLHRESGDNLFEPQEIAEAMKEAKLVKVRVQKIKTDIWFSPDLAKQNLSHAQVWYDAAVENSLSKLIDKYGMKYPALYLVSGTEDR